MEGNPVVQVALIAESNRLQMMLSTYGISTQTPLELEPVQIWPSWKLVKVRDFLDLFGQQEMSAKGVIVDRPGRYGCCLCWSLVYSTVPEPLF